MAINKPSWFDSKRVMVSTAPTCGLTKGGRQLPLINPLTGEREQIFDKDTGILVDAVNDQLLSDTLALRSGAETDTLRFVDIDEFCNDIAVPAYYDKRYEQRFHEALSSEEFSDFCSYSLADLVKMGYLNVRGGHGSPSQEQRIGKVPYIKVSDLRAGLVNINPTNRVLEQTARKFWKSQNSGLQAFDLLCPERTSKNIGDFCVLMPGQEQVLLTKEIIVLRPGPNANFDQFYLLWAMTLQIVRDQWKRVVFMQTNREDVGKRYLEISIPIPKSVEVGERVSQNFRIYFQTIADGRKQFSEYLRESGQHHFFVSGSEEPEVGDLLDE